jgi:hypothetical protein
MSGFRGKGFGDRLSTAEKARKAMLERVRAKPAHLDPPRPVRSRQITTFVVMAGCCRRR